MGIGETLCRALAKLVMGAAGEQAKTVCGNLQLCAGLESGIEGATHALGQQILVNLRARRRKEEAGSSYEEEETADLADVMGNLIIDTAGTKEEAAEGLEAALNMEMEVMGGGVVEGE